VTAFRDRRGPGRTFFRETGEVDFGASQSATALKLGCSTCAIFNALLRSGCAPAMPGRPPYEMGGRNGPPKSPGRTASSCAPEYNYGPTAVPKKCTRLGLSEWNRKAAVFVSRGGALGARSVQQPAKRLRELAPSAHPSIPCRDLVGALPRRCCRGFAPSSRRLPRRAR
jgi:hypothetical protein